jgi:hypothetical protein
MVGARARVANREVVMRKTGISIRAAFLAAGACLTLPAYANPHAGIANAMPPVFTGDFVASHTLIDLPSVVPQSRGRVLIAAAGALPFGMIVDPSQVSPLGDAAWVASLRGPDPSAPRMEVTRSSPTRSGGAELLNIPGIPLQRSDAAVRNGQVLANGRVFLIGAERSPMAKGGTITLAPGRSAELGDIRVPFVRVFVAAPSGQALDVDALVRRSPGVGMFSALFAPASTRRGESGATAVAAVKVPANLAAQIALVEDRSVVLQPLRPAAVEDRIVIARSVPVEERSELLASIPPATVEERAVLAFAAPTEERSAMLGSIPPASVEEREILTFLAPAEERSVMFGSIPPASVEERVLIAFVAPTEERSTVLGEIPPAVVIERGFVARITPVEDRSAAIAAIPPAVVEERLVLAFAAPVEDRATPLRPLVPATVEERVPTVVARAPTPVQAAPIGKPVPAPEPLVVAAANEVQAESMKKPLVAGDAPSEGLVRVAINPLHAATVVIASSSTTTRLPQQAPVKFNTVQRRLPAVMIDRKGGFFFM